MGGFFLNPTICLTFVRYFKTKVKKKSFKSVINKKILLTFDTTTVSCFF
jgi:hypothetical protein